MEIHIQNRKKGFTLAELLVVVAIVAILAAISIPIFTRQLEASREATDLANVRSAYAEVMAAVMIEDTENEVKVVKLKQKKAKWQSHDPVTIGGVMHYNDQGDTANWIGYPVPGGECEVSYQRIRERFLTGKVEMVQAVRNRNIRLISIAICMRP
ncbi:prepilin-type N-terminal cleavage/methylation domain-containing protein [Clostridium sp. AM48-13]|uniref:type IV pilin protein n=1 Tax=Clostridium sp. AM48-13 TaxID=2293034 RepID=UPI001FAA5988